MPSLPPCDQHAPTQTNIASVQQVTFTTKKISKCSNPNKYCLSPTSHVYHQKDLKMLQPKQILPQSNKSRLPPKRSQNAPTQTNIASVQQVTFTTKKISKCSNLNKYCLSPTSHVYHQKDLKMLQLQPKQILPQSNKSRLPPKKISKCSNPNKYCLSPTSHVYHPKDQHAPTQTNIASSPTSHVYRQKDLKMLQPKQILPQSNKSRLPPKRSQNAPTQTNIASVQQVTFTTKKISKCSNPNTYCLSPTSHVYHQKDLNMLQPKQILPQSNKSRLPPKRSQNAPTQTNIASVQQVTFTTKKISKCSNPNKYCLSPTSHVYHQKDLKMLQPKHILPQSNKSRLPPKNISKCSNANKHRLKSNKSRLQPKRSKCSNSNKYRLKSNKSRLPPKRSQNAPTQTNIASVQQVTFTTQKINMLQPKQISPQVQQVTFTTKKISKCSNPNKYCLSPTSHVYHPKDQHAPTQTNIASSPTSHVYHQKDLKMLQPKQILPQSNKSRLPPKRSTCSNPNKYRLKSNKSRLPPKRSQNAPTQTNIASVQQVTFTTQKINMLQPKQISPQVQQVTFTTKKISKCSNPNKYCLSPTSHVYHPKDQHAPTQTNIASSPTSHVYHQKDLKMLQPKQILPQSNKSRLPPKRSTCSNPNKYRLKSNKSRLPPKRSQNAPTQTNIASVQQVTFTTQKINMLQPKQISPQVQQVTFTTQKINMLQPKQISPQVQQVTFTTKKISKCSNPNKYCLSPTSHVYHPKDQHAPTQTNIASSPTSHVYHQKDLKMLQPKQILPQSNKSRLPPKRSTCSNPNKYRLKSNKSRLPPKRSTCSNPNKYRLKSNKSRLPPKRSQNAPTQTNIASVQQVTFTTQKINMLQPKQISPQVQQVTFTTKKISKCSNPNKYCLSPTSHVYHPKDQHAPTQTNIASSPTSHVYHPKDQHAPTQTNIASSPTSHVYHPKDQHAPTPPPPNPPKKTASRLPVPKNRLPPALRLSPLRPPDPAPDPAPKGPRGLLLRGQHRLGDAQELGAAVLGVGEDPGLAACLAVVEGRVEDAHVASGDEHMPTLPAWHENGNIWGGGGEGSSKKYGNPKQKSTDIYGGGRQKIGPPPKKKQI